MDTAATPDPAKATLSRADLRLMSMIVELSGAIGNMIAAVRLLSIHAPPDVQAGVEATATNAQAYLDAAFKKMNELTT